VAEDVAARGVDPVGDARAAVHGRADLEAQAAGQGARERHAAQQQIARARDLEAHEGLPAVVDSRRRVVAAPRRLARPDDVVAWLADHRPAIVAVDSPCCLAPDGTRSRPDERRFAREVLSLRYTPDRAGLEARADYYEWIAHGLELYAARGAAGLSAVECFPTACWTIWAGPRGEASRARWSARALAALGLAGVPAHLGQDDSRLRHRCGAVGTDAFLSRSSKGDPHVKTRMSSSSDGNLLLESKCVNGHLFAEDETTDKRGLRTDSDP